MLLVATNKTDLASDYLILRLKERNVPFLRLNTEDFGRRFSLDITISGAPDFCIKLDNGECFPRSAISAVYFRQPRVPIASDDIAVADRLFVIRESKEALRSLWRLIDDELWLNHPRNLWLASNKIEQLSVAREIGFSVPETCVTSSRQTLRDFFRCHNGRVICKAIKHGFSHVGTTVTLAMTKRIETSFIDRFDDYASVPMIYQSEIVKDCDIRVTVVGSQVFATAIHSQEYKETEVDWRIWDVSSFDLRHEAITLPPDIADACRELTARYGLRYAAIDLVLSVSGKFLFLELNPNGQWAWIEKRTGYPIRDSIIDLLLFEDVAYA